MLNLHSHTIDVMFPWYLTSNKSHVQWLGWLKGCYNESVSYLLSFCAIDLPLTVYSFSVSNVRSRPWIYDPQLYDNRPQYVFYLVLFMWYETTVHYKNYKY